MTTNVIELDSGDFVVELTDVILDAGAAGEAGYEDHGTQTTGTITFDRSGEIIVHRLQVGGNLTIATDGWPAAGVYGEILMQLVNAGAYTVTFDDTITWLTDDSLQPDFQASGTDFAVIWTVDGGASFYGALVQSGEAGVGGGATDFTDLGDVPSSYTGEGKSVVFVKSDESGLDFSDILSEVGGTGVVVSQDGTSLAAGFDGASTTPLFQVIGDNINKAAQATMRFSGDANGPGIHFAKSRGSAASLTYTVVQANDNLGNIFWNAADGTDLGRAARIKAEVDGTPGAGDLPGRIVFGVSADGSETITDRMTLKTDGGLIVGTTSVSPGAGGLRITSIELGHDTANTLTASGGTLSIEGVAVLVSGGALGTPASGTLTNCTGLPVAGITASTSTALGVGSIELGHASANTLSASSGVLSVEGVPVAMTGLKTIWVPASAMTSRTTSGAGATTREINSITTDLFAFDTTTAEGVNFCIAFPKSWNEGTVTFQAFWTAASSTGTVKFDLRGGGFADNVAINATGLGTKVGVTDTLQNVDRVHNAGTSSAVTLSNAAVDTVTYFEVTRDVANDTLAADAELIGIKLFYTTDAGNDA